MATPNDPTPPTERRLISFVLPVYDEEGTLEELHDRISAVMKTLPDDHEMVFVDDGSTDRSFDVLKKLQRSDPKVRVVQLRRNFGKAAAYSAGFEHATGRYVLTMDADLQDDPADLPKFLEKLEAGHDCVMGWKHRGKGPWHKAIPSRLFNAVVRRITGIRLHDLDCPFRGFRREVLAAVQLYGELYRYMPIFVQGRGFRVTEIPIENRPRVPGKPD